MRLTGSATAQPTLQRPSPAAFPKKTFALPPLTGDSAKARARAFMETPAFTRKIAFLGDYLPRKCGIATFTSDLLTSVAAADPATQCFAVPVNDIEGGYEYPGHRPL